MNIWDSPILVYSWDCSTVPYVYGTGSTHFKLMLSPPLNSSYMVANAHDKANKRPNFEVMSSQHTLSAMKKRKIANHDNHYIYIY